MKYQTIKAFKIIGGPMDGSTQKLTSPMEVDEGSFTYAENDGECYSCVDVTDGIATMHWIPPQCSS